MGSQCSLHRLISHLLFFVRQSRLRRTVNLLIICGIAITITVPPAAGAENDVPDTLDEAFSVLDRQLNPEDRDDFRRRPESEAVALAHFGLGLHIRNEWLRHGGSRLASTLMGQGAQSFDDMSGMILTSYWRHLNGVPIEIEKQGQCYSKWREEQDRLIAEAKAAGQTSYKIPGFLCP